MLGHLPIRTSTGNIPRKIKVRRLGGNRMVRRLDRCLNIEDIRRLARRLLPRTIRDFVDGGAEDERTMAANRAAFGDWSLVPAAMQNVAQIDARVRILGQDLEWPFLVGPTGMPGLLHPDGRSEEHTSELQH